MGKKRFAATLEAGDHKTSVSKFSSSYITAWVRGWSNGVEVLTFDAGDGVDGFEIYTCGGSNARSNDRRLIGKVVNGEFIRMN